MDLPQVADSDGSLDEVDDSHNEAPQQEQGISVSEEEVKQPESINGHEVDTGEKRQRKKVQRLSETWNRAHEAKEEERIKAVQAVSAAFEGATGTALGEIPLIEASIRKAKPASLKSLHLIIYGRPGSASKIRSSLRKFRGFGFEMGSEQYEKKSTYIQQRPACDLREVLRILNLEVTGTREQLASRLLEFLLKPTANSVKCKGKIVKKYKKNKSKDGTSKKLKSKPSKKNTVSNEPSIDNSSQQDIDEPDDMSSESENSESDISSVAESIEKKQPPKKRALSQQQKQKPGKPSVKRAKKHELSDTEDENDHKHVPTKMKKELDSDEENVPLSSLTSTKVTIPPTDSELKKNIIDLLKTVNLEETSLKVVREKIFANYPNIDLSDRKDFINSTVKEFLAHS
ncbi:unnamed protein product [Schistosoma rodhaini]|uniref:SAP domain-containing protein n=1 Tax=Schistosoma mansoni TaxID=6183 RepID=G4VME0_SCHMA|nr:hypothetical protein Smp_059710 [Schistosoma mansoni]CAH8628865.1 unnamed protein product [Schistosoma rodhaini]|eukprot:XP_018653244.1 hypothetical protein Smp_059710 [Schistosoma mansoni]